MIKKLIIKLFIFIVFLACAAPFLMKDNEGRPLMTIDKIKMPHFSMPDIDFTFWKKKAPMATSKPENLSPDSIVPGEGQNVVKMFTYKDEKGVSHFTDHEPVRDDYQVLYLPASEEEKKGSLDKIKEKITDLTKKTDTQASKTPEKKDPGLSLPAPYLEAKQTIEDAKALKKQVEESYQKRDKLMNE